MWKIKDAGLTLQANDKVDLSGSGTSTYPGLKVTRNATVFNWGEGYSGTDTVYYPTRSDARFILVVDSKNVLNCNPFNKTSGGGACWTATDG